ncbi:hypothetical protein [Paenibacillus sedimenti]|uniref:Uncharacterized protein n=1 Tax=Paenibacillus sedimenti TaxID=2770274 RepID=A0A926KNR6_9BACL|nr:hypothetical protein [Paenibacillus sedimenti]MBD0381229.1 hypothetical protein [Paenibacillus sedimenti]
MQSITIQLLIIDTDHNEEQARKKVIDAMDDLINEFCVQPIEKSKVVDALLAVNQAVLGFLLTGGKEILVWEDVTQYVELFMRQHNERHIDLMRMQAAQRGWKV